MIDVPGLANPGGDVCVSRSDYRASSCVAWAEYSKSHSEYVPVIPSKMQGRPPELLDLDLNKLRFDYSSVPPSLARFLSNQADRIRRQCVTSIVQMGNALHEAKRHLSHGRFLLWLEAEVRIPARTAQAYMRVASWASDKSATVAHLPPSILYLLSASSTPKEFVADVVRRTEGGEYVAPANVRKQLKAVRARERRDHQQHEPERQPSHWQAIAAESKMRSAVNELVAILTRGLSGEDFECVRNIMIRDITLNAPLLAENLQRAFSSIGSPADVLHDYARRDVARP